MGDVLRFPSAVHAPPDVCASTVTSHETWVECRLCGRTWKAPIATPGVLHRYTICDCSKETPRP